MHWRIFQIGFIAGVILAAIGQEMGSTGFQTMVDIVAAGVLMGILAEALAAVLILLWNIEGRPY